MNRLSVFLQAKSIAVVGASDNPLKVGHQIFRNLLKNNASPPFAKKLYPINPHLKSLLGQLAFASLADVPGQIELVIIVTPAATVSNLIDEILTRNQLHQEFSPIKAVMIISAGFAETSSSGKELQNQIAEKLAAAKIALIGPNSLGVLAPELHLNATFAQRDIPSGNIGLISQSGAMLTALFDVITSSALGVSFAVSLGNKADLNENDALRYAASDPQTRVIAFYLESFANLPEFFDLVSKISKRKPVIVLKGGTSQRGQAASASHTAALATNQVLLSAAALQMGFVLVNTIEELINTVFFLSRHQYLIENTMIITNAGGPAVNTIDRLAAEQVNLAKWSELSTSDLKRLIPMVAVHNPLDLLGDASPERYKFAIQIAQHDQNIDSLLIIITPQAVTDIPAIIKQIIQLKGKKPFLVALMGGDHLEKFRQQLRAAGIMTTDFPNDVVNILQFTKRVTCAHFQKTRFISSPVHHPMLRSTAIEPSVKEPIELARIFPLLRQHGFTVPSYQLIDHSTFTKLRQLKYPLFAKTGNLSILHKKKVGAVYGEVTSFSSAAKAFHQLKKFGEPVLYQELLAIETELLLGIENDAQFGLYLTIGLGGSYANILADRAYIFLPATKAQLRTTWETTKAYQVILQSTSVERSEEIVNALVNLQKIVMKNPWLKSIEINPLAVNRSGLSVADVKASGW